MSKKELVNSEDTKAVAPVRDYSHAVQQFVDNGDLKLYLNLPSANGKWTIGTDKDPVPNGTKVVVNASSFEYGHVYWLAGRPVASVMGSCAEEYPEVPTITHEGDPIPAAAKLAPQYLFEVGFDNGRTATVRGGTKGLLFVVQNLLDKIVQRAQAGETKLNPVVTLEVSSYTHKEHGLIHSPKCPVVGWV